MTRSSPAWFEKKKGFGTAFFKAKPPGDAFSRGQSIFLLVFYEEDIDYLLGKKW